MSDLQTLQKTLGYTFKNTSLLERALTHRSKHKANNNERLEFLGDAVLSLVISQTLFEKNPKAREGELSRLRAALVNGDTIAKFSKRLGIDQHLKLGVGEQKSGGQQRESILAGVFEGVLGAIYLDSDLETVKNILLHWYGDVLDDVAGLTEIKDAKTCLQEWLQGRQYSLPVYDANASGPPHQQIFDVTCRVEGFIFETNGQSTSRRKAEQLAAKKFLEKLNDAS